MKSPGLRTLILLWFFLSGAVGSGLLGPNRTSIEAAYGLSHLGFGVLIALAQVGGSTAVLLLAGRLAPLGAKRLLIGGIGLQSTGFFLVPLLPGPTGLAAGWTLVTAGTTLGGLLNNTTLSLWPNAARRGLNFIHSANGAGKVVGPGIAAAFVVSDWRLSFPAVGCLSLLTGFFFLLRRRELGAAEPPRAPSAAGRRLLRTGGYWLRVLPFGLVAGGEAAFTTLLPAYLARVGGFGPTASSALLSAHLLGLVTGRLASAQLGSRLSNNAVIGGCLLTGLAVFPVVWSPGAATIIPSLYVLGFLFSSPWPTSYAQVAPSCCGHRDMLAYGSALGSFLGMGASVLLSSFVADRSLTLGLLVGPAILALFGLLYYGSPLSRLPGPRRAVPEADSRTAQPEVAPAGGTRPPPVAPPPPTVSRR